MGILWGGTTVLLVVLSPLWIGWSWDGPLVLRALGAVLALAPVAAGTWAVAKMGWARLLFAGALFPPGAGAEENNVPQRLVLEGPYRYVRNPLYDMDFALILGTVLLTSNWLLVLPSALYVAQLVLQLPLGERELRDRFGRSYRRYCEVVPRFVPRLRPVNWRELE